MQQSSAWPSQSPQALNQFYGNPDANMDGRPDVKWEAANIVRIVPPYPMIWSWNLAPVKSIALHKKCATTFELCLKEIAAKLSVQDILKYQLDRCGGGYNFRLMRGVNRLSTHSWGCALDLSPERNGLGVPYRPERNMIPMSVVAIFKAHGIVWGGDFKKADAMHFQAATI